MYNRTGSLSAAAGMMLACLLIAGSIIGVFFCSVHEGWQAKNIAARALTKIERLNSAASVEAYRADSDFTAEEMEKFEIFVKYEDPRYDPKLGLCVSRPMVIVKYAKHSGVMLFSEKRAIDKKV